MIYLKDFTPVTAAWLRLEHGVPEQFDRARATTLIELLKTTPDEDFPRGKWATIQHLEYLASL